MAANPASSFFIANTNGSVLHRVTQGEGPDSIKATSGSANARRVAYTTGVIKNGTSPQAVGRVVVFDLDKKYNVLDMDLESDRTERNVNGIRVVGFGSPQIALSPNGQNLAIFSGQVVKLYSVQH